MKKLLYNVCEELTDSQLGTLCPNQRHVGWAVEVRKFVSHHMSRIQLRSGRVSKTLPRRFDTFILCHSSFCGLLLYQQVRFRLVA